MFSPKNAAPAGSPPRAWGRDLRAPRGPPAPRFTPTRVGTSLHRLVAHRELPVHPHARGDELASSRGSSGAPGSPPRAWGRGECRRDDDATYRFTPTRVGTSRRRRRGPPESAVHPHARGDEDIEATEARPQDGSPPRAWGRAKARGKALIHVRFTPTRVGTSTTGAPLSPAPAVHPHARGDEARLSEFHLYVTGSPPRAWGRGKARSRDHRWHRFTPTRVGTSRSRPRSPTGRTVHPHARGDEDTRA